jgi:hypothetical protein
MSDSPTSSTGPIAEGPSCSVRSGGTQVPASHLSGGCCATDEAVMSRPSRAVRATAGAGFLVIAGALSSRRLPGGIALWPTALVPTWFGISHLVASITGYSGCPELGAIPSVMLARSVPTGCGPWERIDRRLGSLASREPASCS